MVTYNTRSFNLIYHVPLCLYVRTAYHTKINIMIIMVSLFLTSIIISQEEIDLKRGTLANLDFITTYSLMDGWMDG